MLAATALTTTAAAEEPGPEPTMVYCPSEPDMEAILGYTFYQVGFSANGCSYVKIDGEGVRFSFDEFGYILGNLRESAESAGKPVVDVPELGAGAFSYADGSVILYWNDGKPDGRLFNLSVPLAQPELSLSLAKLFIAAIAEPPAPTVPAKAFTLTCPTAKQVSKVVGRPVVLDPEGQARCAFKDGDKWISFSTVKGYGSIFDYRDRVKRDVSREPPMNTAFMYFAGLTPGAFATADLSPINLRWQLEEGVIAQMVALENDSVLIRLAGLLKSVQGGPGKPGLPSTGD
ncbi:hypothetical protein [Tessaracoccus antarcticus]|uniref:Uncharacterized protein n=1 Tax=Tessaracoccus antarcticus TaxID=2479848 RepID=A0A3M0GGS0_9ACTN|nr:hypothetical protein [Tessaracoccus antarcticus]RMB61912.1 hypothetical protein EAX62_04780 [Tessaracoccus antarcticus]